MAKLPAAMRDDAIARAFADVSVYRTGTLVTYPAGEDFPRLRGMGFVHDGWVFYMSTRKVWQKAREIAGNPKVSIIFNDTNRRRDHFIQVDGYAFPVDGEEFDRWQEKRFVKEGDALRNAAAGMSRDDWAGWRIEPVRVRINGYISERPFSEAPVVAGREQLGLPPLTPIAAAAG